MLEHVAICSRLMCCSGHSGALVCTICCMTKELTMCITHLITDHDVGGWDICLELSVKSACGMASHMQLCMHW